MSQSIAPQHSRLFMHDCPFVRQTQCPPLQVLFPQHSELFMQSTGVAVIVSAG